MPWDPSQPWPGTAGGASSPYWGGYVRLFVRASIVAGNPFHLGPHEHDALDAGNVIASGVALERVAPGRLWADLSCDAASVETASGGQSTGIVATTDAGTCQIVLADPEGKYDPTNPDSPYQFQGRSRLVPGVPVEVWAESVDPDTAAVTVRYLFTGTADSWGEEWTPQPSKRRAVLLATDATKTWARFDRPEQPPAGLGDNTFQRINRLVTFYGWSGTVEQGPDSAVTLAATTLPANGWELVARTMADEIGTAYFTPTGTLRWTSRSEWFATPPPVLELGCRTVDSELHDVIVEASPANTDADMRNVVRAQRPGGTLQTVQSVDSIEQYGPYEFSATDLGVLDDVTVARWATDVLTVSAFPRWVLDDVTLVPAVSHHAWDLWPALLGIRYVTDPVRIVWAPPDRPTAIVETVARVIGSEHRITRRRWETTLQLAVADIYTAAPSNVFTIGQHANDQLDAGNVLALGAGLELAA